MQVMRRVNDGNGNIDFEGLDVFALYSGVPPEEQTLNRRSRWIEVQSSPPLGGKQSPGSCRTLSRVPETWKVIPLGRNQEHLRAVESSDGGRGLGRGPAGDDA